MNKIKVYLQYPWKFPDSPYYKSLINNPPDDIEYLNIQKQEGAIIDKRFFWFSNFLKKNIRKWVNFFKFSVPNTHLSPEGEYDLIHCAHCLSKNKNKPWVVDTEGVWQFYVGEKTNRAKNKVKGILIDNNCKRILAWTKETKGNIIKEFPEIKDKIDILYPAIPEKGINRDKRKEINLIFSGRYFYWKGGLDAIEAIDKLTKKYPNVYGIVNSEIPNEIKEKYSQNEKITFWGLIPQNELFELYKKSDIMIYPGYSDSFGFAYLESMSFGVPVVTVDGFARKEIIEEGKTGFVIQREGKINVKKFDERVIDLLIKRASDLIENKKLREKMSKNCIEIIKNGKFSIKKRNSQLRRIYEEAIK